MRLRTRPARTKNGGLFFHFRGCFSQTDTVFVTPPTRPITWRICARSCPPPCPPRCHSESFGLCEELKKIPRCHQVLCGMCQIATEPEPKRRPRPPEEEGEAARNNVVMSAGKRSCPDITCYLLSAFRDLRHACIPSPAPPSTEGGRGRPSAYERKHHRRRTTHESRTEPQFASAGAQLEAAGAGQTRFAQAGWPQAHRAICCARTRPHTSMPCLPRAPTQTLLTRCPLWSVPPLRDRWPRRAMCTRMSMRMSTRSS